MLTENNKGEVALHPEGVDRNIFSPSSRAPQSMSPSTRRAWIEMRQDLLRLAIELESPSTRRAWIEIRIRAAQSHDGKRVALHPEGVDRNLNLCADVWVLLKRRPPPGGRG